MPSLEDFRARLLALLAGVEGASGVADLVEARYGVDLTSADGLREAGLDPDGGLVLFRHGDALALAVSVARADRFADLVGTRAEKTAGGRLGPGGAGGLAGVAEAPPAEDGAPPAWRLAWGTPRDGVALVVATAGADDAAARWAAVAGAGGGLAGTDLARAAAAAAGPPPTLWGVAHANPSVPPGLGPAGALLAPFLTGLHAWTLRGTLDESRLVLTATGAWTGEGQLAADWLSPPPGKRPLAAYLPRALTAFARVALDAEKVRRLPALLRDRLLPPRFPGELGPALPSPAEVLEQVTGEVGVAVMGIDAEATVEQVARWAGRPDVLLQLLHTAAVVRLRDPEAARAALDRVAEALKGAGWEVAPVDAGPWRGWSVHRPTPRQTWTGLLRDDVLLVLSGAGEVERLLAVGEDRALPLVGGDADEPSVAPLADPSVSVAFYVTFTRITRELADKGLPPYFLKMINDIRAITAAARARPDGVDLTLELSL